MAERTAMITVIGNLALFSPQKRVTVHLNMSERENGQLPPTKRSVRNRISSDIWEQIKTGYAAGVNLREIARKMNIPEGTVLAHAKRHRWTQQIQLATEELSVMQSDAIRCNHTSAISA
jgi:penicillin V acylase-like amidase (Ntn superfamily)